MKHTLALDASSSVALKRFKLFLNVFVLEGAAPSRSRVRGTSRTRR
ncbi:MAG: hypothetical protein QOE70_3481 [Chthoniobacter sp.]|jgi:hypothetical protein|nr:hypothetical protein [Chthoniobacter sp.]